MTLEEYHAAVVAELVRVTKNVRNGALAGDKEDSKDAMDDGLSPEDAALEILHAAAEG